MIEDSSEVLFGLAFGARIWLILIKIYDVEYVFAYILKTINVYNLFSGISWLKALI